MSTLFQVLPTQEPDEPQKAILTIPSSKHDALLGCLKA